MAPKIYNFIALTIGQRLISVLIFKNSKKGILWLSLGQISSSGSVNLSWGIRVTCVKMEASRKTIWAKMVPKKKEVAGI